MKTYLNLLIVLIVLIGAVMAAALWFIRVPGIDTTGGDRAEAFRSWFQARHEAVPTQFNGSALVVTEGRVLVREAWGKDGDLRALSPSSQFRLASVSKSFTAAAILHISEAGKLDIDRPLSEQMEDCAVEATPAQLMQHRSGLPDTYMSDASSDKVLTISEAVVGICESQNEAEAPGEYSYNNSGYVLLAGVVEAVSGASFEDYLKDEILSPLGLTNTRVWNLVSEDDFAQRATGFDRNGRLEPTHIDGVAGDGAVFSDVDDLRNWANFWLDDRLISRKLKDRAIGRGFGDGYHFGLVRNGDRIEHSGSWLGASTYLGFKDDPDNEQVVVILDNGSSLFIDDMQAEVWAALE